ncbi:hypothetical protein E4U21_000938 [Claviceps maximensis]|nr:hypothetical protein E4U21_000938 [Claviceps maximensis]
MQKGLKSKFGKVLRNVLYNSRVTQVGSDVKSSVLHCASNLVRKDLEQRRPAGAGDCKYQESIRGLGPHDADKCAVVNGMKPHSLRETRGCGVTVAICGRRNLCSVYGGVNGGVTA